MTKKQTTVKPYQRGGKPVKGHSKLVASKPKPVKQISLVKRTNLTMFEKALFTNEPKKLDAYFRADIETHAPILALDFGNGKSYKNNYWHTLQVVTQTPEILRVRLAALLHDIGKADTFKMEKGKPTFYNHENVGRKIAYKYVKKLGYSDELAKQVSVFVYHSGDIKNYHNQELDVALKKFMPKYADIPKAYSTDSYVRRLVHNVGEENLEDFCSLVESDVTSKHQYNHDRVRMQVQAFKQHWDKIAAEDEYKSFRSAIDGNKVKELTGLTGKDLGEVIKQLETENRKNLGMTVEEAENFVVTLISQR